MAVNRTEARKAKRAAAFNKEPEPSQAPAPKPGRPRLGRRQLRDRPLAREAVIFHLILTWLKWTPRQAAKFAAVVGTRKTEIRPTTTAKGWVGYAFTYTGGNRSLAQGAETNALNNRRDKILQYAPAMIAGAIGDDQVWLQLTLQALQGYFGALFGLNLEAIRIAETLLRSPAIGWPLGAKAELLLKDQQNQRVKIDLIDT
jgi:hypothetical protein